MEYELKDKDGKIKRYEISYSQELQEKLIKTNMILTCVLIFVLLVLLVVLYRISPLIPILQRLDYNNVLSKFLEWCKI